MNRLSFGPPQVVTMEELFCDEVMTGEWENEEYNDLGASTYSAMTICSASPTVFHDNIPTRSTFPPCSKCQVIHVCPVCNYYIGESVYAHFESRMNRTELDYLKKTVFVIPGPVLQMLINFFPSHIHILYENCYAFYDLDKQTFTRLAASCKTNGQSLSHHGECNIFYAENVRCLDYTDFGLTVELRRCILPNISNLCDLNSSNRRKQCLSPKKSIYRQSRDDRHIHNHNTPPEWLTGVEDNIPSRSYCMPVGVSDRVLKHTASGKEMEQCSREFVKFHDGILDHNDILEGHFIYNMNEDSLVDGEIGNLANLSVNSAPYYSAPMPISELEITANEPVTNLAGTLFNEENI